MAAHQAPLTSIPFPSLSRATSAAAKHSRTQPARPGETPAPPPGGGTGRTSGLLLGFDALALVIATALGVLAGSTETGGMLGLAVIPIWMIWLAAIGAYDRRHIGSGSNEFAVVAGASLRVALAVIALAYLLRSDPARDVVFIMLPAGTGLLVLGRAFARVVTVACRRRGYGFHRVLVVGSVVDVLELVAQAAKSPSAGFQVIAACVPQYDGPSRRRQRGRRGGESAPTHLQDEGDRRTESNRRADTEQLLSVGIPVVGQPHDVLEAVHGHVVDTVVVAGQGLLSRHALRRLAWEFEGTGVDIFFASSLTDVATPRITFRPLGALSLMHVEAPAFEGGQRLLKASTDRLLAFVLALLLSPVFLAISVLIKIDSPGPAFYRQERLGLRGRAFWCLKFRTMSVGADRELAALATESDGVLFKIRADPRVTRVGRLLRRYSVDELPQLFNVLGGSMSLVGPRPPLKSEADAYGHDVHRRLLVKPGMTGLWQVSGRSDLSWAESVRLDLYYVENWSTSLDFQLMARTVVAVVAGRGAY